MTIALALYSLEPELNYENIKGDCVELEDSSIDYWIYFCVPYLATGLVNSTNFKPVGTS